MDWEPWPENQGTLTGSASEVFLSDDDMDTEAAFQKDRRAKFGPVGFHTSKTKFI